MIVVGDPADPRVEPFCNVKERDLISRRGHFVAEGEVVLRRLLESLDFEAISVLVAENRFEKIRALAARTRPGLPIYAASQAVMDAITGFHIHRGVLAIGRRRRIPDLHALFGGAGPRLAVGLLGVANHDNMGGLLRNAAAFGVDGVLLDATCCDPLYRKAIRVSVGAAVTTPWLRLGADDDLVSAFEVHGLEVLALTPTGETELSSMTLSGSRIAVVFGTEGPGLPDGVLSRCRRVRIPMSGGFDSLNVATTSGIVLHHLRTVLDRRERTDLQTRRPSA